MRSRPPRRRRGRVVVLAILVALVLSANFLAYFYTDVLWFQEVGFQSVLWKSLGTQFGVGLGVGILVALLVWGNLVLAARLSPAYPSAPIILEGRPPDPLERYREAIGPYLRWLRVGVALFLGLVMGIGASSQWQTFLLWANRVRFGTEDPQFHKDVGFYVFQLPFYSAVLRQLSSILLVMLLVVLAAHYLQGSIRPERRLAGISSAALAHVSVFLGVIAFVKAAQYWLGQYELAFSTRGVVYGPSYTDVHAQIPALRLLAIISIISAVLFLVNIWARRLSLPLGAIGIWILFAIAAGGIWPWAVQRFSVEPQELQREKPYIARNIEATRQGFNLDNVDTEPFAAAHDLDATDLSENTTLLQNVRLWDPGILAQGYEQLQAIRPYYTFPDVDIDRYPVAGETRQVLISPRELSLNELPEQSRTWANLHLQYTHGYGIVASLANQASSSGQPNFLVKDVPGTVAADAPDLDLDVPSIYFGEDFLPLDYSVVNTDQEEIDYPQQDGVARSQYAGEGGVELGNWFRRMAFAIRETDTNLILSNLIDSNSRILYYRNVRDRVLRAAPFLTLDHDPYITAVDGHLEWIIDGYTTTPYYQYAERFDAATADSTPVEGGLSGRINYIRNSVKVVVDAYSGTMKFYIVDENDPLIQAWRKAFPALFTDEEPSPDLQAHFRYPEDLFDLQTEVYLSYHIDDPEGFYAREDEWAIPRSASGTATSSGVELSDEEIAATYLLIELPGESGQEFVITRPVTPRGKNNMVAMMLARSDPENYGQLLTLQFPRQVLVEGPSQVHNLINQDVEISQTLTLLGQKGSRVDFGSLVTLPIKDSILYIQPLFVTAEDLGIPELKRVVVVYGEDVAMEETFPEALDSVFGLQPPPEEPTPPDEGQNNGKPPPKGQNAQQLQELVDLAGRLYEKAQQALSNGDFETYGKLIDRLGRVLTQAQELSS